MALKIDMLRVPLILNHLEVFEHPANWGVLSSALKTAVDAVQPGKVILSVALSSNTFLQPMQVECGLRILRKALGQTVDVHVEFVCTGEGITHDWIRVLARQRATVIIDTRSVLSESILHSKIKRKISRNATLGCKLLSEAATHDLISPIVARYSLEEEVSPSEFFKTITSEFFISKAVLVFPQGGDLNSSKLQAAKDKFVMFVDTWQKTYRNEVQIELFDQFYQYLLQAQPFNKLPRITRAITLGSIDQDDFNVALEIQASNQQSEPALSGCRECAWIGVCQGGAIPHGSVRNYDDKIEHRSIFCSSLTQMYSMLLPYFLQHSTPQRVIDVLAGLRAEILPS